MTLLEINIALCYILIVTLALFLAHRWWSVIKSPVLKPSLRLLLAGMALVALTLALENCYYAVGRWGGETIYIQRSLELFNVVLFKCGYAVGLGLEVLAISKIRREL